MSGRPLIFQNPPYTPVSYTHLDVYKRQHFHCTIIFVTHDFSEARTLADRAAILFEGKLMAVTPAGALETGYFTPEVNAFLGRVGQ